MSQQQYTHAAIWAIIADSILNLNKKVYEYYNIINPIEHTKTREAVNRYKVEPYVIAADVYGTGNLLGRGGWTWYTGSSSWLYKAGIEYILGLRINEGVLSINPCAPKEWKEYRIRYEFGTSVYNITVKNPNESEENKIKEFYIDGEKIEEKCVKLMDNGRIYEIEVVI